jgi:N-acetylmuramic acid 6-phosphate etherase
MKAADLKIPVTERQNPRTRGLDRKPTLEILRTLNREDSLVPGAVAKELPAIALAVDRVVRGFRKGGRLFYVGAGTSGRMGALDAAECPPTFGVSPRMVQAVVAGGLRALRRAIEGAEDSRSRGARDLAAHRISSRDIVVGIAASGSTPYVLGALQLARKRGAFTIALTSNRRSPLAALARITIAPNTGAEAIAGSTRMKAATAQKLALNLLSTAAMVRLGYVYDNWMVNLARTNRKLERRALRILTEAAGVDLSTAAHTLRQAGHDLRVALVSLKTGLSPQKARRCLTMAHGNLRLAIAAASQSKRPMRQMES